MYSHVAELQLNQAGSCGHCSRREILRSPDTPETNIFYTV